MKTESLSRRLEDLESQREKTHKVKILWYDQVHEPPAPGVVRIKLKWLDEERL